MRAGWRPLAVVAVVAVLMVAAFPALALPTAPSGSFVARGPISIRTDADFTAANGVVAGAGTPADPFVISGWEITTGGTAIVITNVTANFTVRNNSITAGIGLMISQTATVGLVWNNQFIVKDIGVGVTDANAIIRDNSFIGSTVGYASAQGVYLTRSNSLVESNAFLIIHFGIRAEGGSPSIQCNDLHDDVLIAGIYLHLTTNAKVECNIITQCTLGISVQSTIGSIVANNSITSCLRGIDADLNKDISITNNTVRFSLYTQVDVSIASGTITNNLVVDGRADAMIVTTSPLLIANNNISNNVGVGLRLHNTTSDVNANVLVRNSVGIQLTGGSIPNLHANVMLNNTIGIQIPYDSRPTITNMSANIVNNVNIDGTINASQKVYFYREANVVISGQVRDSGFSAGFFGSISAEGNIVLYEVNTALIEATLIAHTSAGVTAVNSFNVVVEGSVITNAFIGVNASAKTVATPVPACAVAVKNTTINVSVDPPATVGVQLRGCLGIVLNNTITGVDTGIKIDSLAWGNVSGNVVTQTSVALDASGRANLLSVSNNTFASSHVGARFVGTVGAVSDNRFESNLIAGAILSHNADLDFERNVVRLNGVGVVDIGECNAYPFPSGCGHMEANGNVFADNEGVGLRLNGSTTFTNDRFLSNGLDGARVRSSTLVGVNASGNGGAGFAVVGEFDVRWSDFTDNDAHGLVAIGSGRLRDSNFTHNDEAGIFLRALSVEAMRVNVSFNLDGILFDEIVPSITSPEVHLVDLLPTSFPAGPADPLNIHLSKIWRNERDGIRAGGALVNATHNWWGGARPAISVGDQLGAFQNGVSPTVRFFPWFTDADMTTTGPIRGI